MAAMTLGVDLRCLPADGSAGGGIAHAARALTDALERKLGDRLMRYHVHGGCRALVRAIAERPCDLLFVPSGAISPGLPVPAIPWVHDLDIFEHPEWFPQSWLQRQLTTRLFRRGIRHAPHVFAVSAYTQQAIVRHARIPASCITVTGEGGDAVLTHMSQTERDGVRHVARTQLPHPFVLVLGTVEPRKNISLICRVWPEVLASVPNATLVIAGQDGWKTRDIYDVINACPQVLRLPDVDDAARRNLLLAASLVCVPSLSEGFGLVALEAAQAGTPVLASRRGALPEVLGDGPWLLDPTKPTTWRDAIIRMLQKGGEKPLSIQNTTWDQAAQTILDNLPKKE